MMKTEKAAEPNRVKETEPIAAIAAMIRQESKAGKLISGAFTDLNDYLKARE